MSRAATIPGIESAPAHTSGQYAIVTVPAPAPASAPNPLGAAEKIVTNPVIKLMAGMIAALVGLLSAIGIAYITLEISTIKASMHEERALNVAQGVEIRDLREWKAEISAQGGIYKQYSETLASSRKQAEESTELLRDIRSILTRKN